MLVKAIMTTPVITIHPDDSLADAITLMQMHKLSGLVVVDLHDRLCGIMSEGDLLRRIELGSATRADRWWSTIFETDGLAEAYKKANGRKVSDVMTTAPVTVGCDQTLAEAAQLMEKHRVKRLPVLDAGKLVGVLTRSDFVQALAPFVAPAYEEQATSDGEIQERIEAEIANQTWADDCRIRVDVRNGRVTLSGSVPSCEHQAAAKVAAENVVGVVAVDDLIDITPILPAYAL